MLKGLLCLFCQLSNVKYYEELFTTHRAIGRYYLVLFLFLYLNDHARSVLPEAAVDIKSRL